MAWGPKSGRSVPLPKNWRFLRAAQLKRDGYRCTAIREDTQRRCDARATDVDHTGDPNDHTKLTSLCGHHHDAKTGGQGGRAAAANRRKPTKPHPGYLPVDE